MEQDETRDQINTEVREEKNVETTQLIHRDDLPELCRVVARTLVSYPDRATVLFLQGNLGSGKTTFTQLLAKEIGVVDDVISPTFVIERRYAVVGSTAFARMIHIDAYRLDETIAYDTTLTNLLSEGNTLICIEWPENLRTLLVPDYVLTFEHIESADENMRSVSFI